MRGARLIRVVDAVRRAARQAEACGPFFSHYWEKSERRNVFPVAAAYAVVGWLAAGWQPGLSTRSRLQRECPSG